MKTWFNTGELPIIQQEILKAPSNKALDLFTAELALDTLPQVGNAFSQTPGDPYRLRAGSIDYFRASQELMHGRLYNQAINVGILPRPLGPDVVEGYYDTPAHHHALIDFIQQEIDVQHHRRCAASSAATARLVNHLLGDDLENIDKDKVNSIRVDDETADLIWRYLTGQIQPSEEALLLMQYPVMKSAEAAKRTMPFVDKAMDGLDNYVVREFLTLRAKLAARGTDAHITFHDPTSGNGTLASIRQYNEDKTMCMVVAKQTVAEIAADGIPTIQLKRKKAMVGISPELEIEGLTPDVKLIDKAPYNLQFVGGSYYFCVKKESTEPDQANSIAQ